MKSVGEKTRNQKNVGVDDLRLIDISAEDDLLIESAVFDSLEDLRLSVTMENPNEHTDVKMITTANYLEVENAAELLKEREQKHSSSESLEPARPSYLRRSLAWDGAFLTSAGVLDSEELSVLNEGFFKAEGHLLSGVHVDLRMRRSAISEPALCSDDVSLESLEIDLFDDMRACKPRCGKVINIAEGHESKFGKAASKKAGVGSQKRVKSTQVSRRQSIKLHGRERIKKEVPITQQFAQQAAKAGESSSFFSKPPKILGRMNLISAGQKKRASLGPDLKMPKSGLRDSCNFTSSSTPPRKSPLSISLTASKDSTVLSSLGDVPASASSKTSSNYLKKRTDSRSSRLASSAASRRSSLGASASSICISSMSNHSVSTSASFNDGWSLEFVSSNSTAKQSFKDLEVNSDSSAAYEGTCLVSDTNEGSSSSYGPSHLQYSLCEERQESWLSNQCSGKASLGTPPISAENTRRFRPSGLKMPSPKIGFFDEERPMEHTEKGGLGFHSGVHSNSPNTNGATNRKRVDKLHPARSPQEIWNPKLRPRHVETIMSQEVNKVLQKVSGTLETMNNPSVDSSADTFVGVDGENCYKTRKIGPGVHDRKKIGTNSSIKAEAKRTTKTRERTKGQIKKETGVESNIRQKVGTGVCNEAKNQFKNEQEEVSRQQMENNPNALDKSRKGNICHLEDQVNGLIRYFEVIDLSGDAAINLEDKSSSSHHQVGENFPDENYISLAISSVRTKHLVIEQQQDSPRSLSKPSPLFNLSSRTPLADKTSIFNGNGSFGLAVESTREKTMEKVPILPSLDDADKENS